jgi:hypothetical protein
VVRDWHGEPLLPEEVVTLKLAADEGDDYYSAWGGR